MYIFGYISYRKEHKEDIVPDGIVSGAELPTTLVGYGGIVQGAMNLT